MEKEEFVISFSCAVKNRRVDLPDSIMVVCQILALNVLVRIQVGQHSKVAKEKIRRNVEIFIMEQTGANDPFPFLPVLLIPLFYREPLLPHHT